METGGRLEFGACAAVDVHYLSTGGARAAAVPAADAAFAHVLAEPTAALPRVTALPAGRVLPARGWAQALGLPPAAMYAGGVFPASHFDHVGIVVVAGAVAPVVNGPSGTRPAQDRLRRGLVQVRLARPRARPGDHVHGVGFPAPGHAHIQRLTGQRSRGVHVGGVHRAALGHVDVGRIGQLGRPLEVLQRDREVTRTSRRREAGAA
jgi:hypothetical protein